jgi:hypothetical protein
MHDLGTAFNNLVVSVILLLAGPTICMLLIRRFVPYLGDRLWRVYCDVLIWLFRAPFRLVRLLVREIRRRP